MGMLPDAHMIGNLTIFFLPPQSVTIIAVVCAPLVSTANPDHVNVRFGSCKVIWFNKL